MLARVKLLPSFPLGFYCASAGNNEEVPLLQVWSLQHHSDRQEGCFSKGNADKLSFHCADVT